MTLAVVTALLATFVAVGVDATPAAAAPGQFAPLTPARLLDTRERSSGPVLGGSHLTLPISGGKGVSVTAAAVSLNVAVDAPTGDGFLTVWPCGTQRPNTATLNFQTAVTRANHALTKLGFNGDVCIFASVTTHVIIDVTGYFPKGSGFNSLIPARLTDTRPGNPDVTVDGAAIGSGATTELRVQVAGRGGVPANAASVALNVAVDQPQRDGFVTVYPCGTLPLAANLNYVTEQTVANAVVTQLDPSGAVCIHSLAVTELIVDVTGWFSSTAIDTVIPHRLADTREPGSQAAGRKPAGATTRIQVAGQGPIPAGAVAAVLNVTSVAPDANGFLTVYPCGNVRPNTASLNYQSARDVPNLAVTALDATGGVCIFTQQGTDIVVDVTAYFTTAVPPPPPASGTLKIVDVGSDCPIFGMGIDSPTQVYGNGERLETGYARNRYAYAEIIRGRSNSQVTITNATDTLIYPAGQFACPA